MSNEKLRHSNGSPRRTTISQIAAAAGVSISSAGDILSGRRGPKASYSKATRERVLSTARSLNYMPNLAAQRLRRGKSGYVGVIFTYQLIDPSMAAFLSSIESLIHEQDYCMLMTFAKSPEEIARQARLMNAEQVEGVVIGPVYGHCKDEMKCCHELNLPTVVFGEPSGSGFDEVALDFRHLARTAVTFLQKMGHSRVALFETNRKTVTAAQKAGLSIGPEWMSAESNPLDHLSQIIKPLSLFAKKWKATPVRRRPTALVCGNDYLASFALHACNEHGIEVPADLSVLGSGNIPESRFYFPPLTTFDHRHDERISSTVQALFQRLQHPDAPLVRKAFLATMVERASVRNRSRR